MYETILNTLSSMVISPLLFCYAFLLNDGWRVPRWALAVLAVLSGFTAQGIAGLTGLSVLSRIGLIELCNVSVLFLCSRARDTRFLFVLCTAGMFAFMMTADCSIFAYPLGVHRFFVRLVMDGLTLGLGARFLRPVFLDVFRSVRRGWTFLSLFPITLAAVFALILTQPGYTVRYVQPETRLIAGAFSLLAVVVYCIFFRFFQLLNARQQAELDNHLVRAQFEALKREMDDRRARDEEARILRHDLRHHLHMLSVCLEQDDLETAGRVAGTIEALGRNLAQWPPEQAVPPEEEAAMR